VSKFALIGDVKPAAIAGLLRFVMIVALATAAEPAAASESLVQRSETYRSRVSEARKMMLDVPLARYVESEFSRLQLPEPDTEKDVGDLIEPERRALFQAYHLRSFYTTSPDHARSLGRFARSLKALGQLSGQDGAAVYRVLVSARDFGAAKEWLPLLEEQDREAWPEIDEAKSGERTPSLWRPDSHRPILHRQPAEVGAETSLVAVVSLHCGPSLRALRAIGDDPDLRRRLAPITQWLAPPEGMLDFAAWQRWNREHPDTQLLAVHRVGEWPWIESWATPQFYFLRQGKVVRQVVGWKNEDGANALREALDSLVPMQAAAGRP